ncbi:MAG: hypothetical protein K8S18_18955 [Desulfobacula sp.]|nr:hypothetical protein [Desulfobacula sp.]
MAETRAELIQEGKDITTHLTDTEKFQFDRYEQVIKNGLNTFLNVGHSLAQIRDNRLYRETHKTFEKYCKEAWDISKTHVNRQVAAYETVNLIESKWHQLVSNSNKSDNQAEESIQQTIILPINEAQARQLTILKNPDDQVKAWGLVLEKLNSDPKAKLTAALISKAVKEVKGDVVKRQIKKTKKAVEKTSLVSVMFKKQYQVMMDILSAEQNAGWQTCSKKEAVRWLKRLVKIAESDD